MFVTFGFTREEFKQEVPADMEDEPNCYYCNLLGAHINVNCLHIETQQHSHSYNITLNQSANSVSYNNMFHL